MPHHHGVSGLNASSKFLAGLLLALPLASQAVNMCTDANGKASFQDKPCETRDAAPQWLPVKAKLVNEANARDTVARLTAAMSARDVVAMRRLFARGFESRIFRAHDDPVLLNGAEFGFFLQRVLQAAKAYRIQRSCQHDAAADTKDVVVLRCTYNDRLELLNRVIQSQGDETMRVGVEDGEVKLLEMSDTKAVEALRKKSERQALNTAGTPAR